MSLSLSSRGERDEFDIKLSQPREGLVNGMKGWATRAGKGSRNEIVSKSRGNFVGAAIAEKRDTIASRDSKIMIIKGNVYIYTEKIIYELYRKY